MRPGDQVWIPQRQREGEVRDEVAPQSYNVDSEGDIICRNRRDLIRLPDAGTEATPEEPSKQIETEPGEQAQTNSPTDLNDSLNTTTSTAQPEVRRSGQHSKPPNRLDPSWTG